MEEEHTIPVIELWGRLLVPLQGDMTDSQMERLRSRVLTRIREHGAEGLVVDASGLWMVDSHLCALLGRMVASARLMGVRAILAGLSPQVVITLEEMGISLEGAATAINLEAALEQLGVTPNERRLDHDELND
jgi:rsbT antagonist protein RsbS